MSSGRERTALIRCASGCAPRNPFDLSGMALHRRPEQALGACASRWRELDGSPHLRTGMSDRTDLSASDTSTRCAPLCLLLD
jgi:hypothetical protein